MKTVLIVDDNWIVREGCSDVFGRYLTDCRILQAGDGEQAIAIMRSQPVDAVLTDLQMPVMDGYQLIEFARKQYPAVPLYAMTGDYTPEAEQRLRSLGVRHCLAKPIDFEAVAHEISGELAAH